mgnify:CR=1 FL=1
MLLLQFKDGEVGNHDVVHRIHNFNFLLGPLVRYHESRTLSGTRHWKLFTDWTTSTRPSKREASAQTYSILLSGPLACGIMNPEPSAVPGVGNSFTDWTAFYKNCSKSQSMQPAGSFRHGYQTGIYCNNNIQNGWKVRWVTFGLNFYCGNAEKAGDIVMFSP